MKKDVGILSESFLSLSFCFAHQQHKVTTMPYKNQTQTL